MNLEWWGEDTIQPIIMCEQRKGLVRKTTGGGLARARQRGREIHQQAPGEYMAGADSAHPLEFSRAFKEMNLKENSSSREAYPPLGGEGAVTATWVTRALC